MSKDVWHEMDKIVDPELLPSQEDINEKSDVVLDFVEDTEDDQVVDERLILGGDNVISVWYLILVGFTTNIYPSKRKRFALQALGLEKSEYDQIIAETIGAKKRNDEVVFENDLHF